MDKGWCTFGCAEAILVVLQLQATPATAYQIQQSRSFRSGDPLRLCNAHQKMLPR